jgi:hypothetical protein
MVQFCMVFGMLNTKPARPEPFDLLQVGRRGQLELGVWVAFPEAPERLRDHTTPRGVLVKPTRNVPD